MLPVFLAAAVSSAADAPDRRRAEADLKAIASQIEHVQQQARRDAVDADVDAALHPLIGEARPVAPYQFDLQVMQRIDVRKAVPDGARKRRIGLQSLPLPGDAVECIDCRLPLGFDRCKDALAQTTVRHQLGIAGGDAEVGFGEHHVEVREHRAQVGPAAVARPVGG